MKLFRSRLPKEEDGFTLPEMLVTILVMLTVLFALYNIFDTSLRVFSFGNDKVEAVQTARLGMERMEREIRAAYPVDEAEGDERLLTEWEEDSISFGNELSGNHKVEPDETITYSLSSGSPYSLRRANPSNSNAQPVVEFVEPDGLEFKYFDAAGDEVFPGSSQESVIERVRITLSIEVDRGPQAGSQELTTDVALRNRGN